ncbi:transglutaminase family protein [soil metagenome]
MTMRLSVRHETRYTYEKPVSYSIQRLHLTPPAFASQRVISWSIDAPGIETALRYTDGFGNMVQLVTALGRFDTLTFVAEGEIDCTDSAGVVRGLICPVPDAVFLRQTRFTQATPEIRAFADSVKKAAGDPLDLLHRLMSAIRERVDFAAGTTNADTMAGEAFIKGKGVCQDHAHIFLSAARHLGIPARYVSGYLATGAEFTSTASHAWAEGHVPNLGWVGFDAANDTCPTDLYARVATGLDASGVVPVLGSRRGGHNEDMIVAVTVRAVAI